MHNWLKTLIVLICPVEVTQVRKISGAWAKLRRLVADQTLRADRLANLTSAEMPARSVGSPS